MLIGLSGKKRSGKSVTTKFLCTYHNFIEVSWAYPLKEIIGKQLMGLTDSQVYGTTTQKETVDEFWGKSPREILQLVGTDCFRSIIHPDFWVKIGERQIKRLQNEKYNPKIVVSDCRFPNEADKIKELGGHMVRIIRKGYEGDNDQHLSETALDDYDCDYTVAVNDGNVSELYVEIEKVMQKIKDAI